MKEKHMRFGDFIRKKRQTDPRHISMQEAADYLGISLSYISAMESCNKRPFDGEKLEQIAHYYNLSEEDTAIMYDIAARENKEVPYDVEDIFLYEEIGELARKALRLSKAGVLTEKDWVEFIQRKG